MATYNQIQEYVKEKHDVTVKTCWIAHMKEICGLPVKMSHRRYDVNVRTNPCPKDKQGLIVEAFRFYGMIE